MTQTVFTLLSWAFVEIGIAASSSSVIAPNVTALRKCFTALSIRVFGSRQFFESWSAEFRDQRDNAAEPKDPLLRRNFFGLKNQ
jgi:hypothetical protein